MEQSSNKFFFYSSFFIQCITITYFLSTLLLWLNISINSLIFPIAILISLVINIIPTGKIKDYTIISITFTLLLLISTYIYDYSYDGQCYHSGTILLLCKGWNPIYQHDISIHPDLDLWINHYAKGMETVSACIVSTFHNLETGKSINLLFLISTLFCSLYLIRIFIPKAKVWIKAWIGLITIFNPVVINQLFTYYIDYAIYSIVLLLITFLYSANSPNKQIKKLSILNTCLLLFFVPNIKFNILFWILLFMLIYTIHVFIQTKCIHKKLYTFLISGILGVIIGAYNPYITNIIHHNTPFYPLSGSNSVDIMSEQVQLYSGQNRIWTTLHSLISNPLNDKKTTETQIFSITLNNIKDSGSPDTRIGGFGIFFFEANIILIFLYILSKLPDKKRTTFYLFILLLSLFILPSGWWARYVAFFYLFPIIIIIYLFHHSIQNKIQKKLLYISMTLLSLNACISFGISSSLGIINKIKVDNAIRTFSDQNKNIYELSTYNFNFLYKLNKAHITYKNNIIKDYISHSPYNKVLKLSGPPIYIDLNKYELNYKNIYGIKVLTSKK